MRGALLRSGKSGSFTALGETGQPVYRAALQLREAIRRKNPELVDHLAIPQSDELGNQIDWYSALDGDVIPWSSATEEERAPARRQLEALKTALEGLSQRFLGTDSAEQQQGDKAVFGKLLKRVIHFPDENFVYLVQGKPVLTFWGFEHAGTGNGDPLHCLYQVPPAFRLPPVVEAPVVAPAVPVVARPWWRRWWWLLLLPLLLLLLWLLLGLRGCVPIPLVAVDLLPEGLVPVEKQLEEPPLTGNVTTLNGVPVTGTVVGSSIGTGTATAVTGTHDVEAPAVEGNEADAAPADLAEDPAKDPAAESPTAPPENKTAPPDVTSPEAEKSAATKPGPPLSIPPDAADGAARFLDGQYRAGAGIQDRRTGKPLRLEYQLKDGKGQVTVHQADGSKCSGPVSATMKGGSLAIDSQGQAVCGDGSTYDMPKVNCRKGATTIADCTGGYGKEQFPMSMRQVAE
ncbi:putative virulence effector protein [Pseudomonas fluorescens]|uniref:Putative virulence effector protein n=1 Tax=Pseudomonas fluorescens TaxID=294 RepID=A0A0N8NWN6_PSEFL|nr:SrfA family protein [Pseudomonas fluorescens]KPU57905.1 putative virulence effector protein [Pseudomonas fluorescens]